MGDGEMGKWGNGELGNWDTARGSYVAATVREYLLDLRSTVRRYTTAGTGAAQECAGCTSSQVGSLPFDIICVSFGWQRQPRRESMTAK
jgi:hypothetical protein